MMAGTLGAIGRPALQALAAIDFGLQLEPDFVADPLREVSGARQRAVDARR